MTEEYSGFYGKIPSLGDFVSRRLPRRFITPWETWLQEAIANSRQQLGDSWLDNYLTSPLWRFALTPGICGESGWAGIIMPSVDRVGRYYPFTLATRLEPTQNLFRFMEQSDGWFSSMEEIALFCLDDDFEIEELEKRLRVVTIPPAAIEEHSIMGNGSNNSPSNNAWHAHLGSQSALQSVYSGFLTQLMKKLLFAYSLWWTQGSERIEPSLLICQGLPHINGAASLIDGAWQNHGWEEIQLAGFQSGITEAKHC